MNCSWLRRYSTRTEERSAQNGAASLLNPSGENKAYNSLGFRKQNKQHEHISHVSLVTEQGKTAVVEISDMGPFTVGDTV